MASAFLLAVMLGWGFWIKINLVIVPLHFLSIGVIIGFMSCHLCNATQAASADMQWMEFLQCKMVLYTHSEWWNLLAWTYVLKR